MNEDHNIKSPSIFDFKIDKYKNIICSNCEKKGHILRYCLCPIKSYGIIFYKFNKQLNQVKYLMICRKHTIGYIEFIRGNYNINNLDYLKKIFNIMSKEELDNLKKYEFKYLWNNLWSYKYKFNVEYRKSKQKFYDLKHNKYSINIDKLVELSNNIYATPEWEFPKGRKNLTEIPVEASIREFYEETNISKDKYILERKKNNTHIMFNEEYMAFNNKTYNLSYYLAKEKEEVDININDCLLFNKHQKNEISNLAFYTLDEVIQNIRPYYKEKIKLINRVDKYINRYLLNKN
jgi:8-oxo-dGTP pyrophosphatase MutT (NUDIX family)